MQNIAIPIQTLAVLRELNKRIHTQELPELRVVRPPVHVDELGARQVLMPREPARGRSEAAAPCARPLAAPRRPEHIEALALDHEPVHIGDRVDRAQVIGEQEAVVVSRLGTRLSRHHEVVADVVLSADRLARARALDDVLVGLVDVVGLHRGGAARGALPARLAGAVPEGVGGGALGDRLRLVRDRVGERAPVARGQVAVGVVAVDDGAAGVLVQAGDGVGAGVGVGARVGVGGVVVARVEVGAVVGLVEEVASGVVAVGLGRGQCARAGGVVLQVGGGQAVEVVGSIRPTRQT